MLPSDWMQQTATTRFFDKCRIHPYSSATSDAHNQPVESYSPAGSELSCGFSYKTPREVLSNAQIVVRDAVLRLPVDTTISKFDRVEITNVKGQALASSLYFEVVGEPQVGPSALVVDLRSATS